MAKIGYGGIRITDETDDLLRQYFWWNPDEIKGEGYTIDAGAYILNKPVEVFKKNPVHGGGNLLTRSDGIAVRDGLTELSRFTADGVQIGPSDINHTNMTQTAFESYGADGTRRLQIGDAVQGLYTTQVVERTFSSSGTITLDATPLAESVIYVYLDTYRYWPLGSTGAASYQAMARLTGGHSGTWGDASYIGGKIAFNGNKTITITPKDSSHPIFVRSILYASETGYGPAYTFGNRLEETDQGVAINYGDHSFAIGRDNVATAPFTIAIGEGLQNHVPYSTIIGRYCDVLDLGDDAFMIGNGTSEDQMGHAMRVDWTGNMELSGDIMLKGHYEPIGTVKADETTFSLATSGSLKDTGCQVTLGPGVWIIDYQVVFPAAMTSGNVHVRLGWENDTTGGASSSMQRSSISSPVVSTSSLSTSIAGSVTTNFNSLSSNRIWKVLAWQNSGSTQSVTARITATRIV